MEYRRLGNSDLEVSVLSLGCLQFGREDEFGTSSQEVVDAIVRAALDAGINLFDTAETYARGRSEEALGRALASRRDRALIATKHMKYTAWTKESILDSLKASLRRLGADYVDLYQMHTPNNVYDAGQAEIMIGAFEEALRQGLTRAVGVSNFRMQHLRLLSAEGARLLAGNQIPLSLLWRTYDEEGATAWSKERGVSYLAYSPIAEGLLAGRFTMEKRPTYKPLSESKWAREDVYPEAMKLVDEVREVARETGRTPTQVALRWVVEHERVGSVIVGTLNPKHMAENLGALGWKLAPEHAARLERASLEFQKHIKAEWMSCWGPR